MIENQKKSNDTRQTGMIENKKKSNDVRQTGKFLQIIDVHYYGKDQDKKLSVYKVTTMNIAERLNMPDDFRKTLTLLSN